MKKDKDLINKITEITTKAPITSPIQQERLVSKVNSLTFHSCANSLTKPQNKSFINEKGFTLNYKTVVDELVKISEVASIAEFYAKIYSIISQNIDSDFMVFLLKSSIFPHELNKLREGSAGKWIKINHMREVKLPIPDYNNQKEYGKLLRLLEDKIQLKLKSVENNKKAQKAILDKLVGD